jgi:glycosyltransferase involved in cell wall biosynthesis
MPERVNVLELRSVRGTGGGPEKTIMLGAAQADPREFAVTVCYIRDARDRVFSLGERAAGLGLDYVEVFERHSLDPGIWPALRRLVRERAIHIVHAHEYKTDLLALLLARAERVVPVATVHGWTGHTVRERIVYYPADRRLLARYPRLIAVSGEIREQLVAAGARADCVSVVLNGIDPERFRRDPARVSRAREALGYEPAHLVVGAVGRLEAQKRFDLLIDAVARLLPDHPSVRLVIAGGGSLFHELQRHAGRVLPDGSWRLLGHTDDVGEVYHAIDVLVQSSDYEGTPNAVLEAMAFETPVVARADRTARPIGSPCGGHRRDRTRAGCSPGPHACGPSPRGAGPVVHSADASGGRDLPRADGCARRPLAARRHGADRLT